MGQGHVLGKRASGSGAKYCNQTVDEAVQVGDEYFFLSDTPYDPETEAVGGLIRDSDKKAQAFAIFSYVTQSNYAYMTYLSEGIAVAANGRLAYKTVPPGTYKRSHISFHCVIYPK